IPARRNFLKSDTVEHRHIVDEFQRVALAHPNIYFTFYHNGSELFNLPPSNTRQRIVNIFSGKTNEKLVPVQETTEIVSIQGFVSKPEFAKKSRSEQFFFVNNRFIKSGYLHHAIMAAYEGLLKDGSQPSYFLYLDVPPHSIDINIHPTKTEIKFDDENALYAILRSSIKHSLGQFNVAPLLDFERDSNLDTPYEYKDRETSFPTIQVDGNYNPFASSSPKEPSTSHSSLKMPTKSASSWEALYMGLNTAVDDFTEENVEIEPETETVVSTLFEDHDVQKAVYKTYQIHKKYIVNPIKSGMVIVDQQRAHQRVLYEQFLTNMTIHHASSQQLLFPLRLFFSSNEMQLIAELKEALVNTGFVFEETDDEYVQISGIPVNVTESEVSILLEQLLSDLQDGIPENSFSQNDSIAKSMAKSLAVKTGTYLTEKEQENLINGLFACKDPNVSPFQKPTFITLRVEDLDKKFAI
ncbi:MAG: DNA mismatch repair protein MutL, partial [Flavobacterium sp.]